MKPLTLFKGLAGGLVAMQIIDSFLTLWATNNGFVEVNPLMAPIAHLWALPVVKIVPVLLAVWGIAKLQRRFPIIGKPVSVGLVSCIAFYAAVLITNISEII